MRHRAPTPLVRLLKTAPARRGIAAGTVLLLGASSGVYLAVSDDAAPGGDSRVTADGPVGERDGTSYPGAAALEAIRATRTPSTTRGSDREPLPGQARPRPSDRVSTPLMPTPAAPAPSTATPARPSPSDTSGPDEGQEPTASSDPTREAPQPTTQPTSPPAEPEPSSPPPAPSPPSPAPTAPTAPQTTAVTQVAAAGTWTIALASDTAGVSFQCSLDGAAYTACPPVATFLGLRKGRHTLSARAVDTAGTADPSPVVLTTEVTGLL